MVLRSRGNPGKPLKRRGEPVASVARTTRRRACTRCVRVCGIEYRRRRRRTVPDARENVVSLSSDGGRRRKRKRAGVVTEMGAISSCPRDFPAGSPLYRLAVRLPREITRQNPSSLLLLLPTLPLPYPLPVARDCVPADPRGNVHCMRKYLLCIIYFSRKKERERISLLQINEPREFARASARMRVSMRMRE